MTSDMNARSVSFPFGEVALVAGALVLLLAITGDSLPSVSLAVLYLVFRLHTISNGPPVLLCAIVLQWVQVSLGVFYFLIAGRQATAMVESDYRPMVLIGLFCVLLLAVGLRFGMSLVRLPRHAEGDHPVAIVSWTVLIAAYVAFLALQGSLFNLAIENPSVRQILITFGAIHLGLLYLMLRRFTQPTLRWYAFGGVIVFEVLLGFTGFFAGFKEPLVLGAIALVEIFDRRRFHHWLTLGAVVVVLAITSVVWMGIRNTYRTEWTRSDTFSTNQRLRFNRAVSLTSDFVNSDSAALIATVDGLVDRMWPIFYPALAVARVPSVIPHTGGTLMRAAIEHVVTPRIFFPGKQTLRSESELVREYAGAQVAGREEDTTIAFGYAAESYVDFGMPFMFVPIFAFAVGMGALHAWLLRVIRCRELAFPLVTITFWLSLCFFDRSWSTMLGYAASMLVYLCIPVVLIDRVWLSRQANEQAPDRDFDARLVGAGDPSTGRG